MENFFIYKLHYSMTLYMTGIIWLVQVIHYPLFKLVGKDHFATFHKEHLRRTSLVIALPMILELMTALYLLFRDEIYRNNIIFLAACILLVLIWIVTFIVSVPKHNILAKGYNDLATDSLIKTNWFRTVAWSIRSALLFYLIN